ncbi:hypothetical protein C2G38_891667 [Gigaspora rosea]|uniref:WD40-repeat-containing domain protein n=1 Tax=Gigaspora rosea TaxID=44941 RepID=A0A397TWR2_9GLOM|nr:hypothetical protein C2G38_891667 [Gigaspora rosea]
MMFCTGKKDFPHGGKEITYYVLSPNMQCIATGSNEDGSIVVWTITKDLIVKYDNSLNANDLERALSADKFYTEDFEVDFAILDITTKSVQILSAQGLEGYTEHTFLENGDLAIVKGDPVYRAYIFSKSNSDGKHKWTCKNIIELEKFNSCHITKKGKSFLCFEIPGLVMQWDLITRKFDMRYILNFGISLSQIKLSFDNALLAIRGFKEGVGINVSIYLTKSGMLVATSKKFRCGSKS